MGVSGNTVRDLKARWQTDVLDLQPDWLSIMIGVNDVWLHFDCPFQPEWHVPLDEYKRILDELLQLTRPMLKGLILLSPFLVEPNLADPMRMMVDRYAAVVRSFADRYAAVLVDTQAAFDECLTDVPPMVMGGWDLVHPMVTGPVILV